MWIFLHKNDAKRILELDNQVGRLQNDVKALQDRWDTERVALHDIKEQVINTLRRLHQRDTRARQKEQDTEPTPPQLPGDRVTQAILERRTRRNHVPANVSG